MEREQLWWAEGTSLGRSRNMGAGCRLVQQVNLLNLLGIHLLAWLKCFS
jgi:hypothetical protein